MTAIITLESSIAFAYLYIIFNIGFLTHVFKYNNLLYITALTIEAQLNLGWHLLKPGLSQSGIVRQLIGPLARRSNFEYLENHFL